MLRALLQISGVERRLQALKSGLETKAEGLIRHSKAVMLRLAVAAGLAAAAIVVLLLAFIAGLVALYLALEPRLGGLGAVGVVGGALAALAALLALVAYVVAGQKGPSADQQVAQVRAERADAAAVTGENEAPLHAPFPEPPPPVTPLDADAIFALTRRYTRMPRIGVEPIDELLTALIPRAEEASKEALARAANLVRYGDRSTMLTILATAVAAGWMLTRVNRPERKA
jgi:hypothetical protein